jgi:hypothetical protein
MRQFRLIVNRTFQPEQHQEMTSGAKGTHAEVGRFLLTVEGTL